MKELFFVITYTITSFAGIRTPNPDLRQVQRFRTPDTIRVVVDAAGMDTLQATLDLPNVEVLNVDTLYVK